MNKELLYSLGLNQNEAKLYLLLLKRGELSPVEISDLSGLTRQNSYTILGSLEKKGIIKKDDRHNKIRYVPENPTVLVDLCERQKQKLFEIESRLDKSLPDLMSFYNLAKDRPGISYFKGLDGVKRLYEDTLKRSPKEILIILSEKKENSYLDLWLRRNYKPQRISKKIFQREIINTNKKHDAEKLKKYLWEKKYVNMPKMPKNVDILIYDDNVTFINYSKKEPTGFTIDDQLYFLIIESLFETIWNI